MGGETPAAEAETNDDGKPDPSKFEYGEADPQYIVALSEWAADQRFEVRNAERQHEETRRQLDQRYAERLAQADHLTDFTEVLTKAQADGFRVTEPFELGIKASEVGPDIVYHLAKNPSEVTRISAMSVTQQAYEFGKLEARMEAQAEARKAPAPASVAQPSKAPPPPTTVTRGAGGRFSTDAATSDFAAFEAMANRK